MNSLRRRAVRRLLWAWPVVVASVSDRMRSMVAELSTEDAQRLTEFYATFMPSNHPIQKPQVQRIRVEDGSRFLQHMAEVEGRLRVDTCKEGCLCKMEVRATAVTDAPGKAVVTVGTFHDALCPLLVAPQEPQGEDA